MSFEGTSELSLDAKFRITIPARHREALSAGGGVVLTIHPDGCIYLYPKLTWEPMKAELLELGSMVKDVRDWRRLIVGHADTQEIDGSGRVLVSTALRRLANLESKAVIVGQGRHCELWDPVRWDEQVMGAFATAAKGPPPGAEKFRL